MALERAEGIYLFDDKGNRYIDGSGGPMAVGIGHSHPRILRAVSDQMARYAYVHPMLANPRRGELCDAIADVAPGDLNNVFLVSGGSEAVESAIKIVRQYHRATGHANKYKVISLAGSYHGMTLATMALAGSALYQSEFEPMMSEWPHIAQYSDFLKPAGMSRDDWGVHCAQRLETAIEQAGADTVAAFIATPHGCSVEYAVVPPVTYWKEIRRICDRHHVLFIADEVVTGFGRTGKWFGMQHFDVQADLMTVAKGMASCTQPLGAVVVSDRVNQPFLQGTGFMHGFTYQGHAAACAAGIASIEVYRDEGVIAGVPERSKLLFACKDRLLAHPGVADVRGWGMFMSVELVSDKTTRSGFAPDRQAELLFLTLALRNGLALYSMLFNVPTSSTIPARGSLMRMSPPLTITPEQVVDMTERFETTLSQWEARMGITSHAPLATTTV
ncbi:aminotransferase class III-fold pyridoxal phosphate-dependent enzyme [Comamonadaceae bacterium G21597-S1]|nr:aminotransferase class III-fold pyridoxal phosphate-dependent enzyme [Comamonadaceae bacterium G21597-S1]